MCGGSALPSLAVLPPLAVQLIVSFVSLVLYVFGCAACAFSCLCSNPTVLSVPSEVARFNHYNHYSPDKSGRKNTSKAALWALPLLKRWNATAACEGT